MRSYKKQEEAISQRRAGELVWAQEGPGNTRSAFLVGGYEALHKHYYSQRCKKMHELFFADEPCTLFMDLDLKGGSKADMDAIVKRLIDEVQAALKDKYSMDPVRVFHFCSSREQKQSKHLFFEVRFASPAEAGGFIEATVSDRTAVDFALYDKAVSQLRLPLSVKQLEEPPYCVALLPRGPFEFCRCLVNAPPFGDRVLHHEARRVRARSSNTTKWAGVLSFFEPWKPESPRADDSGFSCNLRGIICPFHDGAHSNNTVIAHVLADGQAFYVCPFCTQTTGKTCKWRIPEQLTEFFS